MTDVCSPWFTTYLFVVFVHELIYRAHVSHATRQDILYTCKYASLRYLLKICTHMLSLCMHLNRVSLVTWHYKWGSCWLGAHHTGDFFGCRNRALLLRQLLLSMCSVLCLIIFKNVRCQPHPGLIFLSLWDERIVIGLPGTTEWGIHELNVLTAYLFHNINIHFFMHLVFRIFCLSFKGIVRSKMMDIYLCCSCSKTVTF